jgi:beta-phosphoglucomutase-like phosphatase (HAD superfamily)
VVRTTFRNSQHEACPEVLFDMDGTLGDSNHLHVHAWQRAFVTENVTVEARPSHRCIGMDGSVRVNTLSDDADDHARNRFKDGRTLSLLPGDGVHMLAPPPGACELLYRIADLGLQVTP